MVSCFLFLSIDCFWRFEVQESISNGDFWAICYEETVSAIIEVQLWQATSFLNYQEPFLLHLLAQSYNHLKSSIQSLPIVALNIFSHFQVLAYWVVEGWLLCLLRWKLKTEEEKIEKGSGEEEEYNSSAFISTYIELK